MGNRQAKMQRRIESAHERYAGTLLALGMPPTNEIAHKGARGTRHADPYLWYSHDYREKVRMFYIAMHLGTPAPAVKTTKKFVRGYISWLRRQVYERAHD